MPPAVGGPVGYTPPEGGWGWAVVMGAFISIGFSYAFPKSITVFFKEIEVIFNATPSQVSWISSIMLAVMYAGVTALVAAEGKAAADNPLHTRLQTAPAHAEGPGLMKPTGQHHLQKAEMKSCGSQTWTPSGPWLRLEILSIKIMNRTGDKGQPCRSPTCTGNRSDYYCCRQCEPSSCSGRTETEQPLAKAPGPHTHRGAPHTEYHEGHGRMPSPDPQSTCGLVGQTPINPQAPCGRYRAGPVFHDRDENRIVPPES
ncbi:hypothetical protein L3Q82_003616 [Scortum barcoo]|uniref:Uncharacterized protein n=1 Tax=Scortum barcoo TaxID=214431 RepID=A0ACB8VMY1_9TELE|nr:hypothetical protein L3Q82_003616 [Scortum barcoo]